MLTAFLDIERTLKLKIQEQRFVVMSAFGEWWSIIWLQKEDRCGNNLTNGNGNSPIWLVFFPITVLRGGAACYCRWCWSTRCIVTDASLSQRGTLTLIRNHQEPNKGKTTGFSMFAFALYVLLTLICLFLDLVSFLIFSLHLNWIFISQGKH